MVEEDFIVCSIDEETGDFPKVTYVSEEDYLWLLEFLSDDSKKVIDTSL